MVQLKKHIPILRAQMRVRVTVPAVHGGNARAQLLEKFGAVIEDTDSLSSRSSSGTSAAAATNDSFLCKIQPGHFRAVDELVTSLGGQGVEVIDMHVQESGETDISNLKSAIAGMRIQDATSAARSFAGVAAVAEEDEDEDDNYAAPQKKSKKKKKKKRRGRGQESKPHEEDVGLTGGGQPDESGAGSAQPVDLCGYMYCPYKSAYFVVSERRDAPRQARAPRRRRRSRVPHSRALRALRLLRHCQLGEMGRWGRGERERETETEKEREKEREKKEKKVDRCLSVIQQWDYGRLRGLMVTSLSQSINPIKR